MKKVHGVSLIAVLVQWETYWPIGFLNQTVQLNVLE